MKVYTYEGQCQKCNKTFLYKRNTRRGPPRKNCDDCRAKASPNRLVPISVEEVPDQPSES